MRVLILCPHLLQGPKSVGRAHTAAAVADSAASLPFTPTHGALAHILRATTSNADKEGCDMYPAQAAMQRRGARERWAGAAGHESMAMLPRENWQ